MATIKNPWSHSRTSSTHLHPDDFHGSSSRNSRYSDVPSRSQSVSHRKPRNYPPSNPFSPSRQSHRPHYQRSYSSDPFVSPLQKVKQEHKTAHGAPHLKRIIPTDTIDSLDATAMIGGPYHHEGPYDATLASRQIPGRAPVEAVRYGNEAALAATPTANIIDSLTKKKPLQGIGMIAPGHMGPGGQSFQYEEEDLMRIEGKQGRWPGVEYSEYDIKGKGEPGFSQDERDKALKAMRKKQMYESVHGAGLPPDAIQMQNQPAPGRKRSVSDAVRYDRLDTSHNEEQPGSSGIRKLGGLTKRFSLRRKRSKA